MRWERKSNVTHMFKYIKFNKTWVRILCLHLIVACTLKVYMEDAWTDTDNFLAILISMIIGWNLWERPTEDEKKGEEDDK